MMVGLQGLIAATHTPFDAQGDLNLTAVEQQAAGLLADQVKYAFIGGTTGESHSLTVDERLRLAERWFQVVRGTELRIIVHVGTNCVPDACRLAQDARQRGALAIAALAPSYFKPPHLSALIATCVQIAGAASDTPFYFYDIPSMTGVHLSMPQFLEQAASRIPTLRGLKFTNTDLIAFQQCRAVQDGHYDILWGTDELLLAGLALGATGAVGSTYNFAAPIYHRLISAFSTGDWATARALQLDTIRLVQILVKRGYMASAKALMQMRGCQVGPPRLPLPALDAQQIRELREELEAAGFASLF